MVSYFVIELEPLRTILNLESQRGYTDTAVIGGLDRYITNWYYKARDKITFPQELAYFNDPKYDAFFYASLDIEQRKAWISGILIWVDQVSNAEPINHLKTKPNTLQKAAEKVKSSPISSGNSGVELNAPVTVLKGIKANTAAKLGRLGVNTIRDILYFFPRKHIDYSQRKRIAEVTSGIDQTILATIWEARIANFGRLKGTEVTLGDETGNMRAVWFNQPYLAKKFATNTKLIVSGRVSEYKGCLVFESPEWDIVEDKGLTHAGRLVPVYSLSSGLFQRQMRSLIKRIIGEWAERLEDFLPQEIKVRCKLLDLALAILQAHFPDDHCALDSARKRLAFDELFLIQLGVLGKKRSWQGGQPGRKLDINDAFVVNFLNTLPYKLTQAQCRVLREIMADLKQSRPMSRLLQGEVGSGKTVIAIAALLATVGSGHQGALMAPTEILAEQHYSNISKLLSITRNKSKRQGNISYFEDSFSHPITLCLLTGKLSSKEKIEVQQKICDGKINIVIGTHALIQKNVEFKKLVLVIIDEQHRFGVLQRSALRQKGFNPHLLVMTATPIPRTLALTLYGDLDLSIIDELPPGRQIIKTRWLKNENRSRAYDFIRRQIAAGHQAFIICPLIEESDTIEAKAATVEYEWLSKEIFPELTVGLLHGRIPDDEKTG